MPRGKKKSHKGGHRCFTNELDLAREAERTRKEKEWRVKQGLDSEDESEGGEEGESASAKPKAPEHSGSESNEEESSDDDENDKPKGISHLIEIENPNRIKQKPKKVAEVNVEEAKPSMNRKEREELEKQQSRERYQKLHEAGKTEEARSDLARLALVRKQREEAARKRDEAKKLADQKLVEKKPKPQQ